jgi:hypothetical protein
VNDTYKIGPFEPTQAEIIAVLLFLTGIAGAVWLWRRAGKAGG